MFEEGDGIVAIQDNPFTIYVYIGYLTAFRSPESGDLNEKDRPTSCAILGRIQCVGTTNCIGRSEGNGRCRASDS